MAHHELETVHYPRTSVTRPVVITELPMSEIPYRNYHHMFLATYTYLPNTTSHRATTKYLPPKILALLKVNSALKAILVTLVSAYLRIYTISIHISAAGTVKSRCN